MPAPTMNRGPILLSECGGESLEYHAQSLYLDPAYARAVPIPESGTRAVLFHQIDVFQVAQAGVGQGHAHETHATQFHDRALVTVGQLPRSQCNPSQVAGLVR